MNDEQVHADLAGLLETARPELTPELGARAVAAVEAAGARPARSRRRLIAVAVGAAVAVVGLGFVPVPMGSAKGALDRAMAAMEGAPGVYIRTRDSYGGVTEKWQAPGLLRMELRTGEKLQTVMINGPDSFTTYFAEKHAAEVFETPRPQAPADPGGMLGRDNLLAWLTWLKGARGSAVKVEERRERSLWGGEVDVIEMTHAQRKKSGLVTTKTRWETDPVTGHLLSQKEWTSRGGEWRLSSETEEVTWGEIPSDKWEFVPPKGTKVTYHRWWGERAHEPLARGQTKHWGIELYAVDANRKGDLALRLSRWPTAEPSTGTRNLRLSVAVDGVDDLGVTYHHTNDHEYMRVYWATTLLRGATAIAPGRARTIRLTVHPYPRKPCSDEVLTFDVPIPPLQDEARPETEVVQY